MNHVDRIKDDPKARQEAYWINTSGNDLVKRFVERVVYNRISDPCRNQ